MSSDRPSAIVATGGGPVVYEPRDCEHGHLARSCPVCELTTERDHWQEAYRKASMDLAVTEAQLSEERDKADCAHEILAYEFPTRREQDSAVAHALRVLAG